MRLSDSTPLTPLDRWCMVEIAKGATSPREVFLRAPADVLGRLSFQSFSAHWDKVRRMQVDVDLGGGR